MKKIKLRKGDRQNQWQFFLKEVVISWWDNGHFFWDDHSMIYLLNWDFFILLLL